jgi:hypothetical protein
MTITNTKNKKIPIISLNPNGDSIMFKWVDLWEILINVSNAKYENNNA